MESSMELNRCLVITNSDTMDLHLNYFVADVCTEDSALIFCVNQWLSGQVQLLNKYETDVSNSQG